MRADQLVKGKRREGREGEQFTRMRNVQLERCAQPDLDIQGNYNV